MPGTSLSDIELKNGPTESLLRGLKYGRLTLVP